MSDFPIKRIVWIALMAALIAVGALTSIPFGPVPFTLQTMFIFLAALLLGSKDAFLAVALYLLLAVIGLPIFAGGKAGLGVLLGPTGGFAIGFLPAVLVAGLAYTKEKLNKKRILTAFILTTFGGTLIYNISGVVQMKFVLDISFSQAISTAAVFVLPDMLKNCLAIYAWYLIKKRRA